ncbi:TatD family hydrolase [Bowmanella denitrificans]|uniref:TatD family hydrolase n=1 Tax=Bowmanella denitrificans TaxID=366582 RepID=UPI000C9BBF00|nr:TatD family hydrolase [Bowmanella denitrificans]
MIDSHCHLDFSDFDHDRQVQIAQARQHGVTDIVIPGVSAAQWPKLITLCQANSHLHFALGLHPYFLADFQSEHLEQLDGLLQEYAGQVVAVGEIGIDLVIDADAGLQEQVFMAQLKLAEKHQLPVIIHHRKSHHLILHCLKTVRFTQGGVIHAYSGSKQQAQAYIGQGFKLGVGGTITYPRARKTRQAISQVPLEALLLETDSPDMPMSGRQGARNSPVYLSQVLDSLVALRQESRQQLERQTEQNTRQLFKLNRS